jgi:hypothetical protein
MRGSVFALTLVLTACAQPQPAADHSHAADEIIAAAKTPAERAELTRVRDEVDAAARDRIKELDAEIERLEKENALLRRGQVSH